MKPGIAALRAVSLFATCSPAVLAHLDDIADLARLGPNEPLFRQGDRLNELNILVSGYVVTTHSPSDGNDAAADIVEPIRPLALTAALRGTLAPVSARTATSARLIVIAAPALRAMIGTAPALLSSFLDQALDDLQELTLENCRLKLLTSTQRLAGYLLGRATEPEATPARFVLPFEKRLLAVKLGCTQANLSRAFTALRSLGVSTKARAVVIGDLPALRACAGLPAEASGDQSG